MGDDVSVSIWYLEYRYQKQKQNKTWRTKPVSFVVALHMCYMHETLSFIIINIHKTVRIVRDKEWTI